MGAMSIKSRQRANARFLMQKFVQLTLRTTLEKGGIFGKTSHLYKGLDGLVLSDPLPLPFKALSKSSSQFVKAHTAGQFAIY